MLIGKSSYQLLSLQVNRRNSGIDSALHNLQEIINTPFSVSGGSWQLWGRGEKLGRDGEGGEEMGQKGDGE